MDEVSHFQRAPGKYQIFALPLQLFIASTATKNMMFVGDKCVPGGKLPIAPAQMKAKPQ